LRGSGVEELGVDAGEVADIDRPFAGGRNIGAVRFAEDQRAVKTGALADDFIFHNAIFFVVPGGNNGRFAKSAFPSDLLVSVMKMLLSRADGNHFF
jgi:hypothetical protein